MIRSKFLHILIFLIIIWLIMLPLRTSYYFLTFITSDFGNIFLSDEQKKDKYYGEMHQIYQLIQSKKNNTTTVLFVSNNGDLYHYLRYELYPNKIIKIESTKELYEYTKKINNLAVVMESDNEQNIEPDLRENLSKRLKVKKFNKFLVFSI